MSIEYEWVCNVIFSGIYMSTIRKSLGKNGGRNKLRRIQPFNSAINCIRMVILKDLLLLPIYLLQVNLQLLLVTRILILRRYYWISNSILIYMIRVTKFQEFLSLIIRVFVVNDDPVICHVSCSKKKMFESSEQIHKLNGFSAW